MIASVWLRTTSNNFNGYKFLHIQRSRAKSICDVVWYPTHFFNHLTKVDFQQIFHWSHFFWRHKDIWHVNLTQIASFLVLLHHSTNNLTVFEYYVVQLTPFHYVCWNLLNEVLRNQCHSSAPLCTPLSSSTSSSLWSTTFLYFCKPPEIFHTLRGT